MKPFRSFREYLSGQKVFLRNLLSSDINSRYLSWLKDRDVTRFMSSNLPSTIRQLKRYCRKMNTSKKDFIFAIALNRDKAHIGNATLQNINRKKRTAVFGIMIGDKKEWHKGYGREATSLVLRYGFSRLGLKRITLGVYPDYKIAIRLYRKTGFRPVKKEKNSIWMQIENSNFIKGRGI